MPARANKQGIRIKCVVCFINLGIEMKKTLVAVLFTAASTGTQAIDSFAPLTQPATSQNTNENSSPFVLPPGWTATKVTDHLTLGNQTGYQSSFGRWDMISIGGVNHEYIYIPMEVSSGAGVVRYNRDTKIAITLVSGSNTNNFSFNPDTWNFLTDDFGSLDSTVLTNRNTLLYAEEGGGRGRAFEILNPETSTGKADSNVQWLSSIPSVSHEGIKFDTAGRVYFIDEDLSGSLYRLTPKTAGDLTIGRVEVLKVDGYTGSASWDGTNQNGRTGSGRWVEIVNIDGNVLTSTDPFAYNTGSVMRGGRAAADEVGGTPFGRPEDMEITTLANGNEAILMATTLENIVYSIELNADGNQGVVVKEFVSAYTTPSSVSNPVGDGGGDAADTIYGMDDVDNLATEFGANGEIQLFIVEDEDPSDIWVATDADGDGIAETVDLFASLGPFGSEATGFFVDPRGGYLVNIQHPTSGNDALWSITQLDTDGDGVVDTQDAFPTDPTEWSDADADGVGDNADTDDDNDGLLDIVENQLGTDPLVIDDQTTGLMGTRIDTDGDGVSDYYEINISGTDPHDQASTPQLIMGPFGDINGDGFFNVGDLVVLQRMLLLP